MLDVKQRQSFREQGYVVVSNLFSPEHLDRLEAAFDHILKTRLAHRANLNALWPGDWREQAGADRVILHTHDVQAYDAQWTKALIHEPLTDAMADCLGSPNVQLHHTKLFQKPSEKGGGFPMHQDAPYFPHAKHTMMAAVIHLSDADEKMGCFRVYPGSHKLGLLPEFNTDAHYLDPEHYPIEGGTACPAKRGDVLFFHYLLIHGSGPNVSSRTRKTVLIQVRDPTDYPSGINHRSHSQGLMLRGVNPLEGKTTAEGTLESDVSEVAPTSEVKR